jgi:hypothetical protein
MCVHVRACNSVCVYIVCVYIYIVCVYTHAACLCSCVCVCVCVYVCVFKEAREGLSGVDNSSDMVDIKQVRQDQLERKNLFAYTGLVSASGTKRFS